MPTDTRSLLTAATLKRLFGPREDPYEGADLTLARRFVALLWAMSSLLAAAFLPMRPPTVALGSAGWLMAAVVVLSGAAGARWLLDRDRAPGFRVLLAIAYGGLALTAALQWAAGGADSPYGALFLLWLCAGVGVHPPRRALVFIAATVVAVALPLLYAPADRRIVTGMAGDALLWIAVGFVLIALIAVLRSQRAELHGTRLGASAEVEQAERKVRGLEAVADAALAQLPLEELVDDVLGRICSALDIDSATIFLHDSERDELAVAASRGDDSSLAGEIAGRVMQERKPVFIDEGSAEDDPRALLGVPLLLGQGRSIGVIQIGAGGGRRFSRDESRLLQLAADRVAVGIDRARLNEQAHRIAETLQRSLLPNRIPDFPGVTITTRYRPGADGTQVGGDLYDVMPLPDGRIGLAMGDVVGHGVEAASLMGQLRNALRAYALEDHRPASVLERLNRLVDSWEVGQLATLIFLVFDPRTGELSWSNAGHPPPVLRTRDGAASFIGGHGAVPLGVLPVGGYAASATSLDPGVMLVLYTDGLIERRDSPIDEGLERLRYATERAPHEVEGMCEHILSRVPPVGGSRDDVALLTLRVVPVETGGLQLRVPAEPSSLAVMRHELRRWLTAAGADDETTYEIAVACGEACTNAVEHAYPPGDAIVMLEGNLQGGAVELTVRDHGLWRAPSGGDRGRGIELMRRLMDSAVVTPGPQGTVVRMRRELPERATA